MQSLSKQSRGFTIVELLIVIVVIGILAAIVIVAYNGIQTRASNTQTIQAVGEYTKIMRQFAINDSSGKYPVTNYACLGSNSPVFRCGNMTSNSGSCNGAGATISNATFDSAVRTVSNNFPQLSSQQMNCGGDQYMGGWYNSADGVNAQIKFYLKGTQTAPSINGINASCNTVNATTDCTLTLPTP